MKKKNLSVEVGEQFINHDLRVLIDVGKEIYGDNQR
jgi:hypothetical protein